MKRIVVVAPHPDDETLGCGGTLLRHKAEGGDIHWLIVTGMKEQYGYKKEQIQKRAEEINQVAKVYGFTSVHQLDLPPAKLDILAAGDLVAQFGDVFRMLKPSTIYIPYVGDIHSDHRTVFNSVASCTKWFRHSSIKKVLAYETISETNFGIDPTRDSFRPNVFVDISAYLDAKMRLMNIYASEMGEYPFPRSEYAVRALAAVRGTAAGCKAAEAFMLLKEII